MVNVQILEEKQEGEDEYKKFKDELPFRTQSSFNLFGGEKEYVTLRCPKFYFYVIQDKFGANVLAHPDGKGNITVNVPVAVGPQFFGWVFGMGGIITIVGPKNIKQQYRDMLSQAVNR